jgi:ornithine cyclodeaminase
MQVIDAYECANRLPFGELVPALADAFAKPATVPERHHHELPNDATLLLMPAWSDAGYLGVKWANIFPSNADHGRPAVSAAYLLASAETGEHLAVIDGDELTRRRTVAVAALAASKLARDDARTLLIVGAGHIGSLAAEAYAAVRDIENVLVYSRTLDHARKLADRIGAEVVTDLPAAVGRADIVSCATLAREPVVRGAWLRDGTHVDLIGSFRPTMHEVDDVAVARAQIFVDTEVALTEAGELASALASGVIDRGHIRGTLAQLCGGDAAGRRSAADVTLFKTVGTGLADLAAATLAYTRA